MLHRRPFAVLLIAVAALAVLGCQGPTGGATATGATTQPVVKQSFANALLMSQVRILIAQAALALPPADALYVADAQTALDNLAGAGANATQAQQDALVGALQDAESRLLQRVLKSNTGK